MRLPLPVGTTTTDEAIGIIEGDGTIAGNDDVAAIVGTDAEALTLWLDMPATTDELSPIVWAITIRKHVKQAIVFIFLIYPMAFFFYSFKLKQLAVALRVFLRMCT